jgi:hypothetical protein
MGDKKLSHSKNANAGPSKPKEDKGKSPSRSPSSKGGRSPSPEPAKGDKGKAKAVTKPAWNAGPGVQRKSERLAKLKLAPTGKKTGK